MGSAQYVFCLLIYCLPTVFPHLIAAFYLSEDKTKSAGSQYCRVLGFKESEDLHAVVYYLLSSFLIVRSIVKDKDVYEDSLVERLE